MRNNAFGCFFYSFSFIFHWMQFTIFFFSLWNASYHIQYFEGLDDNLIFTTCLLYFISLLFLFLICHIQWTNEKRKINENDIERRLQLVSNKWKRIFFLNYRFCYISQVEWDVYLVSCYLVEILYIRHSLTLWNRAHFLETFFFSFSVLSHFHLIFS